MRLGVVKRRLRETLPPVPVRAADSRWSVISSATDLYTRPNDALVDVLLRAAERARTLHLEDLTARCNGEDAAWVRCWPGEHYRLLAALVATQLPNTVVEIGTFKGQGSLALAGGNPSTEVITYDVVPWTEFTDSALRPTDLVAGRLEQRIGDLGDPKYLQEQLPTLQSADMIFIDGPKDGSWEQDAIPRILSCLQDRRRLVVLDDIALLAMAQLWRDLPYPKLDATSLGHWSGTGLLHTI